MSEIWRIWPRPTSFLTLQLLEIWHAWSENNLLCDMGRDFTYHTYSLIFLRCLKPVGDVLSSPVFDPFHFM